MRTQVVGCLAAVGLATCAPDAGAAFSASTSDVTDAAPITAFTYSATLVGKVTETDAGADPAVSYHFEYGPSFAYGMTAPVPDAQTTGCLTSEGTRVCQASAPVTDLQQGVTYHFRLVATADGGPPIVSNDGFFYAGPPVNHTLPSISGTTQDGSLLTAAPGAWSTTGVADTTHQWRRCDALGGNCADIPTASASTYLLSADDVGSTVRVVVTLTDPVWGATSATSAATAQVAAAPATLPVNVVRPTITGALLEQQTLTVAPGQWTASEPITYGYQWRRCGAAGDGCVDIDGATGTTYLLTHADADRTIVVVETATVSTGARAAASLATGLVVGIEPPPPPPPPSPPPPGASGQGAPVTSVFRTATGATSVPSGAQVIFDAIGSSGQSPLTYAWDFDGSGAFATVSAESHITHVFDAAGPQAVSLRVTNPLGQSAVSTQTITVGDPAGFVLIQDPPYPKPNERVRFSVRRTGAQTRSGRASGSPRAATGGRLALAPHTLVTAVGLSKASQTSIFEGARLKGALASRTGDFSAALGIGVHNIVIRVTDPGGYEAGIATQIIPGKDPEYVRRHALTVTWEHPLTSCPPAAAQAGRCAATAFWDTGFHESTATVIPPLQEAQPLEKLLGHQLYRLRSAPPIAHAADGTEKFHSADLERWTFGDGRFAPDKSKPCPHATPEVSGIDPGDPHQRPVTHAYDCAVDATELTLQLDVERHKVTNHKVGGVTATDSGEWPITIRKLVCGPLRTAAGYTVSQPDPSACWTPLSVAQISGFGVPGDTGVRVNGLAIKAPGKTIEVNPESGFIGVAGADGVGRLTATILAGPNGSTDLGRLAGKGFNLVAGTTSIARGMFACRGNLGGIVISGCTVELHPADATLVRFDATLPQPLGEKLSGKDYFDENHQELRSSYPLELRAPAATSRLSLAGLPDFDESLPDLDIGPFALEKVSLTHASTHDPAWHGGGKVRIPNLGTIDAHDGLKDNPPNLDTGFGLSNSGAFSHLGAHFQPGDEAIPVDPFNVFHLVDFGLNIHADPWSFQASGIVRDRKGAVRIDGCVSVRDGAGTGKPVPACVVGEPSASGTSVFTGLERDSDKNVQVAVAAHETVDLKVAQVLGDARLTYITHKGLDAKMAFNQSILGVPAMTGILRGSYSSPDVWSLVASARAAGGGLGTGTIALSSRGFGLCFVPPGLGFLADLVGVPSLGVGAYVTYAGDIAPIVGVCDATTFRASLGAGRVGPFALSAARLGRPRQAADVLGGGMSTTVRLTGSAPHEVLVVRGAGGAPKLTLKGPNGERFADDGSSTSGTKAAGFAHVEDQTFVALRRPARGRWSLESSDHPILGITESHTSAPAKVRGRVTRVGAKRRLTYTASIPPGAHIVFTELGAVVPPIIARTSRPSGTITFTPGAGAGRHTIVARVEINGILDEPRKLGTFMVPKPRPLAAPRRVTATLRKGAIVLRWQRVAGAAGYRVTLRPASGVKRLEELRAGRTVLRIPRAGPGDAGTAVVQALAKSRLAGREAKVRLPRPKTVLPRM